MNLIKNLLKILIGIFIIAGVCYGLNTLRENKKSEIEQEIIRPVRTVTLKGGNSSFNRRYFGTVQGGKRADLSFRVPGTLNKINVEKGAAVKKGELLATLDPRDFNTALKQAQSAQAQAQAQYKNAQADFKRYENLYKQKVIARAQYDAYKTQVDVTRSAVNTAAAVVKSAHDAVRDTELRAPFDGIIADRMIENFQDVMAKQTIFSLQDFSTLEIVFNIPDNDVLLAPVTNVKNLNELRKEAKLFNMKARFEAMPERVFDLEVKEISTQATAANTYPITATMPKQNDIRILPGMAVTVEVDFSNDKKENENTFSVPSTAILNENGRNYVWKFLYGTVSKIPVETGSMENDGSIEISGVNLHNEDVIVTAGVYFLHEGQKVRLMEE